MKKKLLFTLLLAISVLPVFAQSNAYLRFSQNPNLDVAFVQGFRINDSTAVDVTVIMAKDSSAMLWLMQEFNLMDYYIEKSSLQKNTDPKSILSRRVSKDDPTIPVTQNNQDGDMLVLSLLYNRINIYHITNPNQLLPILKASYPKRSSKNNQQ